MVCCIAFSFRSSRHRVQIVAVLRHQRADDAALFRRQPLGRRQTRGPHPDPANREPRRRRRSRWPPRTCPRVPPRRTHRAALGVPPGLADGVWVAHDAHDAVVTHVRRVLLPRRVLRRAGQTHRHNLHVLLGLLDAAHLDGGAAGFRAALLAQRRPHREWLGARVPCDRRTVRRVCAPRDVRGGSGEICPPPRPWRVREKICVQRRPFSRKTLKLPLTESAAPERAHCLRRLGMSPSATLRRRRARARAADVGAEKDPPAHAGRVAGRPGRRRFARGRILDRWRAVTSSALLRGRESLTETTPEASRGMTRPRAPSRIDEKKTIPTTEEERRTRVSRVSRFARRARPHA